MVSQSPANRYGVLVVGCGPVGLTLANLLGSMAIRTLVIERNATTVQEPRAVSIDDESLRTLQAVGLAKEALTAIVPGYGSHYYSPRGGCFVRVEPSGEPYGYPRRNAFRQPVLERQLREGLARYPSVDLFFGCALVDFEDDDGVKAQLEFADGAKSEVCCDFIVGCDGASSRVRERLGVKMEGTTFDEHWLIVDLENHDNGIKHTEVFCNPRRPAITLPGPQRTRRFEFKILAGENKEAFMARDTAKTLLAAHGADPRADIKRQTIYRFHARVATQWRNGRALLAGDAAHLTPPFAGQGMNSGLRDAHNLAWKLSAVIRGEMGVDVLDSYAAERKDHVWRMIRLALAMGRVMAPKNAAAAILTQTAFRALGLWPPAHAYVAQMKYKPKPRFHSGFLLRDGRSARRTLVGRLFPQPKTRTAAGDVVLLDEALGPGFAILAIDPPAAFWRKFTHPIWRSLAARKIAVAPKNSPRPYLDDVVEAQDESGVLRAYFEAYPRSALLLRPDRYAAAEIPFERVDEIAIALSDLVKGTWSASWPEQDAPLRLAGRSAEHGSAEP